MSTLYFLLGLVIFWAILLTIIFRLEKRMVWPYGELESGPQYGDPSGYGARAVAQAKAAGFRLLGWARDTKGPTYRASYAMLVSPGNDIFAVVGIGAVLKMPVAATWLYTPTMDGRCFYSTDKQTGVQIDLSRNWRNQLASSSSFGQLWQKHRDWLRTTGVLPRSFTPGREFEEFRTIRQEHYRSMEHAGLICYTDGAATHFRFTLSGAAKTAIWGYFLGMARQVSHGRFPRTA